MNTDENDLGPQPLDRMMEEWKISNHKLVEVSTEQLTHKQVQRARSGRRLTLKICLLYTSPSPRDQRGSRMPSSA